jgi:hypothetical protein
MHVAVGFALDIAHAMECLHSHGICINRIVNIIQFVGTVSNSDFTWT